MKVKKGEFTTVGLGARKSNGDAIEDRRDLEYRIEFQTDNDWGCTNPEKMFASYNTWTSFDSANPSAVFAAIEIKVPENFEVCTQKVFVKVQNRDDTHDFVGSEYFIIEVIKSGIF